MYKQCTVLTCSIQPKQEYAPEANESNPRNICNSTDVLVLCYAGGDTLVVSLFFCLIFFFSLDSNYMSENVALINPGVVCLLIAAPVNIGSILIASLLLR